MIGKLRRKLIMISMLSLFLVLTVIMAAVNCLNYQEIVTQADQTLAILRENGGSFPKEGNLREPEDQSTDEQAPARRAPEAQSAEDQSTENQSPPPKPGENRLSLSPELPYESRYFGVCLDASGGLVSVDTGKIAAIDTETAISFAQQVREKRQDRGFISSYRYIRYEEEDQIHILFLDCGRNLTTFRTFLAASCAISLLGLVAVFLLMILLSKRLIRPIAESYEKQKQFITNAGHELKTPLAIIQADAEVLEMELEENEWLTDIQLQTKRLGALTEQLVFLSRLEESRPQLTEIEFPFSDVVSETAQSFRSLAQTREITLSTSVDPMITLKGDEKLLTQLVSILLDNALKYTPQHGTISLILRKQKKTVCLTVENTTDQELPAKPELLFDRFYRGNSSRRPAPGGYGLGLSIARAIADAHRAKISATADRPGVLKIQVQFPVFLH